MPIRKNNKDDPISIGNRVKSARMLSGYTRKSFAVISDISMATLRAWEDPARGRYGLTEKGAARLIKSLNECGIYCSKDWLLSGIGLGPKVINSSSEQIFENQKQITWGEEEAILLDIESFKQNNPDPIIAVVTDGSMLPLFSYADYVGGNKIFGEDIKDLIGLNCILETENRTLIKRISSISNNLYTLISLNQDTNISDPIIANVKLLSAAEIVWHRWRKRVHNIVV